MRVKKIIASATSVLIAATVIQLCPIQPIMAAENSLVDKISSNLNEEINNNPSDYYPVVLWGNELADSVVEEAIREEIGYDLDSLESEYIAPSEKMIEELENAANNAPDTYLEFIMNSYMMRTSSSRLIEKQRTDLYRSTRREIVKALMKDNTDEIISILSLDEERIGFISQYAPMIVCLLTQDEIMQATEIDDVTEISLYEPAEAEDCSINFGTTKSTMNINDISSSLNLTGSGIKIGIYENYTVSPVFANDFDLDYSNVTIIGPVNNPAPNSHSTYCAGIAAGANGIAPDAEIYSASCLSDYYNFGWNNYINSQLPVLESLIESDVDVISMSFTIPLQPNCYNNYAKYIDSLIEETKTTIVCATGNNSSDYVKAPASAYNCISVNGFIDNYNNQPQNILNDYAYNCGSGNLKPDVIAPSLNNGTSVSTPYIAGMIALLYQFKPSLSNSPELTKAILMGSCHEKCSKLLVGSTVSNLNETMYAGLTERQGAGIPNLYRMISMVSQHSYGRGVLNSNNGFELKGHYIQPKYKSSNINISMAYLQKNVPTSNTSGVIDDCDLKAKNNGTTLFSSAQNSSTEMIYHQLTSNDVYEIRIHRYSGQSSEIRFAFAWSTDKERFNANVEEEGVYYLRNKKSSLYLAKNTNNNKCVQNDYYDDLNYLWVMDYISSTGKYFIKNGALTSYGLCLGSVNSGSSYYVVDNTSSTVNPITVQYNESDGTYTFMQVVGGITYALGIHENSDSTGAYANWYPYSSNNEWQKWYLETANFRIGDVDYNGTIDNNDVLKIQSFDAGLLTLDNIQKYLADTNKTDSVNLSDVVLILQIIAEEQAF